jgi:hypothetical protein
LHSTASFPPNKPYSLPFLLITRYEKTIIYTIKIFKNLQHEELVFSQPDVLALGEGGGFLAEMFN